MSKLNRRQFLILTAAGAIATSATSWAIGKNKTTPHQTKALPSKLYKSSNGLLELDLEASSTRIDLGGKPAYLLTYNGQIPAPRLEAKAGDTVRIRFTNNLSQPTNLHYHGLHVTPTGNADNAFLDIPSGESLTYEFTLPKNHPSGTFWYHPHRHGFVAEQVFGGLAGLFVIRGELDEIPELKAAKEEFLVLQDFALDGSGRIQPPNQMEIMRGREGKLMTVNGQVNPQIAIARGGLLRLRILNASPSRFYRLAFENHPFYLIATDGGAIGTPVELKELLLSPGERAEVLVRGDRKSGQYRLLNLPYDRGGMEMMGMMGGGGHMMEGGMGMMQENTQTKPHVLATLTYQGSVSSLPLLQQLISVEELSEPKTVRRIELSMAMGSGMGMTFTFNGKAFDPNRVDTQVQLNTVEDWELVNVDPDGMAHPFHLHVNPFQVISRNGKPEPYRAWKDTVLVKGNETVRIRIPFRDFAGKAVYHCHVLDHEDLGMMGIVEMKS
ncbi:copper oxidase [Pleurocapsa sp. CCALA 161]|uniref:multicopper oxidase family protein n=1 Tax=Pleurocapsa sp. CCALA 161 TaxID=2107688 RepID=UPI000D05FFCF|nr:multicopper oxidase family protein [Pleurocapsa sp. CCALA 161]PSB06132.1 copper oxidase [Pleurocapsa sp. CCALA 161]